MLGHIKRFSYSPTETEGILSLGILHFATVERPWIPNPNGARGGMPSESCIPDGMYKMAPFVRPSGELAYIIWNPDLGVYRYPQEHPEGEGRDLILCHTGNFVTDVIGCIAPGLERSSSWFGVSDSRKAMRAIRGRLGDSGQHILSITSETGASDIGN